MAIKLNSLTITPGFQGILPLGRTKKLYVSAETDAVYQLYGTLFKKQKLPTVTPPSGAQIFKPSVSLEGPLSRYVSQRTQLVEELARLGSIREDVLAGRYDYGVSYELVDTLQFLSSNSIKPLPSIAVGGNLEYDKLLKSNESNKGFEDNWEAWSHVYPGLKRYDTNDRITTSGRVQTLEDEGNKTLIFSGYAGEILGSQTITLYKVQEITKVFHTEEITAAFDDITVAGASITFTPKIMTEITKLKTLRMHVNVLRPNRAVDQVTLTLYLEAINPFTYEEATP